MTAETVFKTAAFDRSTREQIGDDSYDAMLYATGRDNRVRIRELLENYPDSSFGFELGDVLLSYDGRLIFRAPELREASRLGEPGEWVTADVLRNGEVVRLRGPRGRIGVRLEPGRVALLRPRPPDAHRLRGARRGGG